MANRSRPTGRVAGVFLAPPKGRRGDGLPAFVTSSVDALALTADGIMGDRHAGAMRKAGPREPWLPRGAPIRNDRQLSALSLEELDLVAGAMELDRVEPQWIGGNLAIEGLVGFSGIAPGSRIAFGGAWGGRGRFDGTAVLRVEGYNTPCRQAGAAIAAVSGRPEDDLRFVRAARRLRGLVLSVDLPGVIRPGDAVIVMPPMTVP